MKRYLRQFAVFLLLVLLVCAVRFPFSEFAEKRLRASAKNIKSKQNISIDFAGLELNAPLSARLTNVETHFPSDLGPIPISIDRFQVQPRILPLFLLRGDFSAALELYDGSASIELGIPLLDSRRALDLEAKAISLAAHPLLKSIGIKGLLGLKLSAEADAANKVNHGIALAEELELVSSSLNLQIDKGRYKGGYKIAGLVEIPMVSDIDLELTAEQLGTRIAIEDFALYSSLGTVKGSGKLILMDKMTIKRMTIDGSIELTKSGSKTLGGYLALQAGQSLETDLRSWSFTIFQNNKMPIPEFKARPVL